MKHPAPNMAGVPGELVLAIDGLNLVFGKGGRVSPYDALLDQLVRIDPRQAWLRFSDVRAKGSLYSRAKRKGMRVSFAEDHGVLYVQFDGAIQEKAPKSPREQKPTSQSKTISDAIRDAVREGPKTNGEVLRYLVDHGFPDASSNTVSTLLCQFRGKNEIFKGDEDLKWHVALPASKH